MDFVFREDPPEGARPAPGELWIRGGREDSGLCRALLVCERGVEALLRGGGGPLRSLVLPLVPTLDDMLAATFAARLLDGKALPAGARAFARYASLVREGLRPGRVPVDRSLEGIFLAVLNAQGPRLADDPAARASFLEGWSRLAGVVMTAASEEKDPFVLPLFEDDLQFARERAFLARDREVYAQDVLRGERWRVAVPGGPPSAPGLLLRDPRSLAFKYWAREDLGASGGPYLFLAVERPGGRWIFSTDPVQRLSLESLAHALQAAEDGRRGAGGAGPAASHRWFDGAPFRHTLVAAPRGGTRLGPAEVRGVVARWGRVGPAARGAGVRRIAVAGLVAAPALALAVAAVLPKAPDPATPGSRSARAVEAPAEPTDPEVHRPGYARSHALVIGIDEYRSESWPALEKAVEDAGAVARFLVDEESFRPEDVRLLKNGEATGDAIRRCLRDAFGPGGGLVQPEDRVFVYFAGHGEKQGTERQAGFIVPADADETRASCVSYAEIRDACDLMLSKHVLLVLDCCFSGLVDPTKTRSGRAPETLIAEDATRWRARQAITAGGPREPVSDELPRAPGHSPFTYFLLKGLRGEAAGDGRHVFASSLGRYVRQKLDALRANQRPVSGSLEPGLEGDFVFTLKGT